MMPPHDVYIESHVGGGAILERKKPARSSIAIDIDPDVCAEWQRIAAAGEIAGLTVVNGDAVAFLKGYTFTGRELIYADPPYVLATRRSGPRYRYEYSDAQHYELLDALRALPCRVILSGYRCPMYDAALSTWHREDFTAWLRTHDTATESLWCNFEPAAVLHDYAHIGGNFRERERIKRKRSRWLANFARLPAAERAAILEGLAELAPSEPAMVDVVRMRPPRKPCTMPLPDAWPFACDASSPPCASSRVEQGESARGELKTGDDALYEGLPVCPVLQKPCITLALCDGTGNACPLLEGPNASRDDGAQLSLLVAKANPT